MRAPLRLLIFRLIAACMVAAIALPAASLDIRIVYDNTSAQPGIEADWGFAAVVTLDGKRLLFDSGTRPELFLANLKKVDVTPASIDAVMISHHHEDHRNGVFALYPLHPVMPVYFLDSFTPVAFAEAVSVGLQPRRVNGPEELLPGLFTTGPIVGQPDEQALVVPTSKGLVILTGCSHPGVVKVVATALRQRQTQKVALLAGGFHLFQTGEPEVGRIVSRLKTLGVESVAPAHCTGDAAKDIFRATFGARYREAGAGSRLQID
jgi:7,8-dihydropterin-6-yl-methyl-4-(beta-D-ribofuranosyl)aminobenzene 5'-phosphate synthase